MIRSRVVQLVALTTVDIIPVSGYGKTVLEILVVRLNSGEVETAPDCY